MFLVVRREQALRNDLCSWGVKHRLQLDSRFAWRRRSWRRRGRLVAICQQGDTFHLVINVDIGWNNGSSGWRFTGYGCKRLWLDGLGGMWLGFSTYVDLVSAFHSSGSLDFPLPSKAWTSLSTAFVGRR